MSELKLKSNLFHIPNLINKYLKNGMQNFLLYSSAGTGKSTIACEIADYLMKERIIEMDFFIDAGIKVGVNEAREHIERLEQYNSTLTIYDEGIKPEAQDALRTITNNTNHYFIICTNEYSKMSNIILDRFTCIDCNIPMTDDLYNDVYEYFEDYFPQYIQKIESQKVDWKSFFEYNFTGSMRSLLKKIDNNNFTTSKNKSIEYMITNYQPVEIQKIVFDSWLKSSKDDSILEEIMETIYRMSVVDLKTPFLYHLWQLKERMK